MTKSVVNSDLINIVEDWTRKNEQEIIEGLTVKTPSDMLAFERKLMVLLMQLGALIIAWVIKSIVEDRDFQRQAARAIIPKQNRRYRHQSNQKTSMKTLFGNEVRVVTRYYTLKNKGMNGKGRNGSSIYPALERIGITNGVTPALAGEIAREVTEGPSMDAVRTRLTRLGMIFDIKVVQRISETFAKIGLKIREEWLKDGGKSGTLLVPEDESLKGMRVMIGIDGGRLRTRTRKRGRIKKGNKRHGFRTDWREPKLLVIRAIDGAGKVLKENLPIYDGTIGDADAIFDLLGAHLRARKIWLAQEIVCMGDGATWIWNRIGKVLDDLEVDPSKVTYGVDYYHAVEHLTAVADGRRGWTQKKRTRWLNRMKGLLMDGKIEQLIEELVKLARGRNARTVKREINYFREHMERMRYDQMREKNLPMGSGATESAIRQVVNMRLKGTGMFWLEHNAEAFLHLRCYLKAGRWDVIERAIIGYEKGAR